MFEVPKNASLLKGIIYDLSFKISFKIVFKKYTKSIN